VARDLFFLVGDPLALPIPHYQMKPLHFGAAVTGAFDERAERQVIMTSKLRLRLEMLLRVRDFGEAHRDLFPESSLSGKAFGQVAQAVAAIETAATATLLAAKDGRREKGAARAVLAEAVRTIARTARALAPRTRNSNSKLALRGGLSDTTLVTTADAFASEVEANQAWFVEHGLAATCASDLRQATDAFERTLIARRNGRTNVADTLRDSKEAFARASDALVTLDSVIPNILAKDAGLLAGWARSREIVGDKPKRRAAKAEAATAGAPADSAKKAS